MSEESTEHGKLRPQMSLWTLGIIVPTVAGLLFAMYANRQHQLQVRESLEVRVVELLRERDQVLQQAEHLFVVREIMRRNLAQWRKPKR